MYRGLGYLRHRHQMIGAEGLAALIAMELIAAGAEHRAACGARMDLQEDVPTVFVIFDGETVKKCVAVGAGGGVELLSHKETIP